MDSLFGSLTSAIGGDNKGGDLGKGGGGDNKGGDLGKGGGTVEQGQDKEDNGTNLVVPSVHNKKEAQMPKLDLYLKLVPRSDDQEGVLDSARRRAIAANRSAKAAGMEDVYEDPKTARYTYREITTARAMEVVTADGTRTLSEGGAGALKLNPVCRELYLNDDEFNKLFGMSKQDFYQLKLWRQRELKRSFGLF